MRLREVLTRSIEQNNKKVRDISLESKLIKIANELENKYSKSDSPPVATDLQEIRETFVEAQRNGSWNSIDNRMWKKACWVLWAGSDPLASNGAFLSKYLEYCNENLSSRIVKSLINVYLREFQADLVGRKAIARFIRNKLTNIRLSKILKRWVDRDEAYSLFEENKNFQVDARKYISSEKGGDEFLSVIGLDGQLESGNYAQELFSAILHDYEACVTISGNPSQLFAKLKDIAITKNNELRYPQKRIALIEALLRPWVSKSPQQEIVKNTLELLLKYFKDPRTIDGGRNWVGVNDAAQRVIRKWLADKTLEQFFSIIKKTAKDEHWKYRHKFWKAYFDDGYIDDAWVALGKDSRSEAKYQSRHGDELMAANVKGTGVKVDHSVLIFIVAGLTITEWSHDGKCRIWCESNRKSPDLYEMNYEAEKLRENENESFNHHTSERYGWQKKIADSIQKYTGIKMPAYKYEVS